MSVDEIEMEALTAKEEDWAAIVKKVSKKYKRERQVIVDKLINELDELRRPNLPQWHNRRLNDLIGAIIDARD